MPSSNTLHHIITAVLPTTVRKIKQWQLSKNAAKNFSPLWLLPSCYNLVSTELVAKFSNKMQNISRSIRMISP